MGRVILCHGKLAEHPFVIAGESVRIFSTEEVCYYLLQHADMIEETVISDAFCDWVEQETNQPKLAADLRDSLHQKRNAASFISVLMLKTGYANETQISEYINQIKYLESKSPDERLKMQADQLVEKKKYAMAIEAYKKILENEDTLEGNFAGNVYHNMGSAYGRLFLYEAAAVCYEKAFAKNMNPESVREYMHAIRYLSSDAPAGETVKTVNPQKNQEMIAQLNAILQSDEVRIQKNFYYRLESKKDENHRQQFFEELNAQIAEWKQSYLGMTEVLR